MRTIYGYDLLVGKEHSWNDLPDYWKQFHNSRYVLPTMIRIWYGQFLDKIQVIYGEDAMPQHGGSEPGGYAEFSLGDGGCIAYVKITYIPFGYSEQMITDLEIQTTDRKKYEFHSWSDCRDNAKTKEFTMPDGCVLVGFGGTTGFYDMQRACCIDGLTLFYINMRCIDETEWKETQVSENDTWIYCLKNNGEKFKPESDIWINTFVDFPIGKTCQSACASISVEEDEVAMPEGAKAVFLDESYHPLGAVDEDKKKIIIRKNSFYQYCEDNPKKGQYTILLSMKADARCFLELQSIGKDINQELISRIDESDIPKGSRLPVFLRPVYKLNIVKEDPDSATPLIGGRQSLGVLWWYHVLSAAIIYAPTVLIGVAVVAAVAAVATTVIIVHKIYSEEPEKESGEKLSWSEAREGGIYTKRPDGYNYRNHVYIDAGKYLFDDALRGKYKEIWENSQENMSVRTGWKINSKVSLPEPAIIDIGGEGCFESGGIKSGDQRALNFNGRLFNSQIPQSPIPMLVHFNDWTKDDFPLTDRSVDIFMMQGCGIPTYKQAMEMIRCIKIREKSRMDFWLTNLSTDQKKCFEYMRDKLKDLAEPKFRVEFRKVECDDEEIQEVYKRRYIKENSMVVCSIVIRAGEEL